MDRKVGLLDSRIDEERREKVQRWLGEKAISFALAETAKEYEKKIDAFEVREYQLDAWANLWDARKAGKKRGLIHLATGLGKTSVGVFDVMKFREEQLAQDPPVIPRILFVSHMNDISDQAHERFKHFMPDLEMEYFKTGRRDLPDADITFATFQSLHSELDRFDPQDFEYIIYDEAHHSEADTFREVREHFDPLFELALTATPGRMDNRDITEYFGEALYSKTLAEGIAEGWLADVDYHIVFDDIVKQLMEEGFEPKTLKEFHELFKVRPRNEEIAQNIREERHKIGLDNAKTIVFCEDVAHAEEMAELLGGVAYHSGVKKDKRKDLLDDFRNGNSKVICTVDMFNEGIDIPDARLLVFLRSTQSGNIFEQQLGRGLRRAPGKERVSVLDFVANVERIKKVRELSKNIRAASEGGLEDDKAATFVSDKTDNHGNVDNGLQIHTAHGEFDFDKIAVDLLEKWGVLRETMGWSEYTKLSNDELVSLALKIRPNRPLSGDIINQLSKEGKFVGSSTVVSRFGSILEFHKACGFNPEKSRAEVTEYIGARYMSDADLVSLARYLKPDGPLSLLEIQELSKEGKFASTTIIYNRFGSISGFQRACDFEVGGFSHMSNDEIVAVAKSLKPSEPLVKPDIDRLSKEGKFPSWNTIVARFGSSTEFKRACGFETLDLRSMSNDDIIRLALSLSPEGPLSLESMKALAKEGKFPSPHMIRARFGNTKAFHEACGFQYKRGNRWS